MVQAEAVRSSRDISCENPWALFTLSSLVENIWWIWRVLPAKIDHVVNWDKMHQFSHLKCPSASLSSRSCYLSLKWLMDIVDRILNRLIKQYRWYRNRIDSRWRTRDTGIIKTLWLQWVYPHFLCVCRWNFWYLFIGYKLESYRRSSDIKRPVKNSYRFFNFLAFSEVTVTLVLSLILSTGMLPSTIIDRHVSASFIGNDNTHRNPPSPGILQPWSASCIIILGISSADLYLFENAPLLELRSWRTGLRLKGIRVSSIS